MPGSSPTSARRRPQMRLNNVDLPTLGRPSITTRGSSGTEEVQSQESIVESLKSNIPIAGKAALQVRQFHAPSCVPNAQKAQKSCLFSQNSGHFGTNTARFFTDFARAIVCFHRLTGFGCKKIRNPFSGILRRKHSSVPQGHVVFRQAKYLDQFSKQRVRGLGGSQSCLGRLDDGARRGV